MKQWEREKIATLLRECGQIALQYYDNPPFELKSDCSVVTVADKAIENRLAAEFDHPEEGVYLIGEETIAGHGNDYVRAALAGTCWIVDPIDGTAPYSVHCPTWGISIAFMQNRRIQEGAIYLAALDELIMTDGSQALLARNFSRGGQFEPLPFKAAPFNQSWPVGVSQRMARHGRLDFTNHIFTWDTAVGVFHYLLLGRLLGYVANVKLWDIAACLALAERGGLTGKTYDGRYVTADLNDGSFELDPNVPDCWQLRGTAVFAANEEVADYLIQHSQPQVR